MIKKPTYRYIIYGSIRDIIRYFRIVLRVVMSDLNLTAKILHVVEISVIIVNLKSELTKK